GAPTSNLRAAPPGRAAACGKTRRLTRVVLKWHALTRSVQARAGLPARRFVVAGANSLPRGPVHNESNECAQTLGPQASLEPFFVARRGQRIAPRGSRGGDPPFRYRARGPPPPAAGESRSPDPPPCPRASKWRASSLTRFFITNPCSGQTS